MLGKKLYKTSMLNLFKLVVLLVFMFFLNDFYLDTFTHEKFQLEAKFKIIDVLNYHFRYPKEFLYFFFLILVPCTYYSLIRGIKFYEKGFVFNRGLPFLSTTILYSQIDSYKILHPKYALSLTTKSGEIFIVADNSMERVLAIIDQQNIKGNLAGDEYVKMITNYRKFIFVVMTFTILLFILKKVGLFSY